jgi:NADH-quinone oxidoreductase subunit G
MDPAERSKVKTAITRLEDELAVSMGEIETADYIICLGADPINEAPMLALALRQAQKNGAKIVVIDPRPVFLPLDFRHLAIISDDLSGLVRLLIKATGDRQVAASLGEKAAKFYDTLPDRNQISGLKEDLFAEVVDGIKISQRPVIICGTDIPPVQTPGIAADFALSLRAADKNSGLFYLLPGANAFGAGLLSDNKASMLSIIEAIEDGDIRALFLVESDPFFQFSDRKRLAQALDALDLLIVLDYINSDAVQKAHIFIPSTTIYESDGVFVNQEGRAQRIQQAYSGGVPIVQSGGGTHPPRIYGSGIPGAAPAPAWLTMAQISDGQATSETKTPPATHNKCPADIVPELADADLTSDIPDEGLRLNLRAKMDLRFTTDFSGQPENHRSGPGNLQLVLTDLTFGTEVLSAHTECLWELETEPAVMMHTSEADSLDLADDDRVSIQTENGKFEAKLKVVDNMATGVLVVPRHHQISWQIFEAGAFSIGRDQIKKVAVKPF